MGITDSDLRHCALGRERMPVRRDIWHHECGDHQDVKVGHEVRWILKIETQGEAREKKDKGHGVRADRPDAVLGCVTFIGILLPEDSLGSLKNGGGQAFIII